jgi:hypothetical protein
MRLPCRIAVAVSLAAVVTACSGGPGSPSATVVIQPIEVESVVPSIDAMRPARVTILVSGALGGGCDELHSIEQRRQGLNINVEIKRSRITGPGVACTAIFKGFRERLALPGTYSPGRYTVHVNSVTAQFQVE